MLFTNLLERQILPWVSAESEVIQEAARGLWKALAEFLMSFLWEFSSLHEGQVCLKITTIYLKGSHNMTQAFRSLTLSMLTCSNIFPFKWKNVQAQSKACLFLIAQCTSKWSRIYFRKRRLLSGNYSTQWDLPSGIGEKTVGMTKHKAIKGEILLILCRKLQLLTLRAATVPSLKNVIFCYIACVMLPFQSIFSILQMEKTCVKCCL